ncbi:hypothetical protein Sfulv_19380 [Streptomyces fulvorobeus]|uniref:Uncharacterized protein n=1 Tax=Streptomyces fulvorobeus TaxID=284028 RepID=A0A7J0C4S4_9ACTN|nr:hypothetical protein [Streptomyces fulvorobeus]GFM97127.1 hypothetical protein Sfulv_19380 [Streptomyces fulvorobeus]
MLAPRCAEGCGQLRGTPETPYTVALLAAASGAQGPGDTLRIVLIVSIGGATLLGWLLLRGHRNEETND